MAATIKALIEGLVRVIVHPGVFHADDVFVAAWLRHLGYTGPIVRGVPSEDDLDNPHVLVADIGGRHEASLMNFDHHQQGGAGERFDSGVPFASFGLVYQALSGWGQSPIADRFHDRLVESVDASDTGFSVYDPEEMPEGIKRRYNPCSVSAVIASFNPLCPNATALARDAAFHEAVTLAKRIIENFEGEACFFIESRDFVLAAEQIIPHVLHLEEFAPWSEHIFDRPDQADLVYVTHPSVRGGFQIWQVPVSPGSFKGRKPLPEDIAGLRGEELRAATGIPDATFVHGLRFTGGAESLEGTLALAKLALE